MKTITIDEELYAYIASQTKYIGEDASDILRRLLLPESSHTQIDTPAQDVAPEPVAEPVEKTIDTSDSASAQPESVAELAADSVYMPSVAELSECATVVERFLRVLAGLHQHYPDSFAGVLAIKGKGRDYFATSKEHLLATGSSTNPKAIADTGYWVVTNNNTSKKASILKQVAETLGYPAEQQQALGQSLTQKA